MNPLVLHGYFLLQCTLGETLVCVSEETSKMYVSYFQDSAGNQLLLIFICQLALGSLKEVPNDPSGQSIRRVLVVVVVVNLWCAGDTNSPQLVDNLSEGDKDNLHFMMCKASRNAYSLEKSCQLVGTTLTNSR